MPFGRTVFVVLGRYGGTGEEEPYAVFTSEREAQRNNPGRRILQLPLYGRVSEIERNFARNRRGSGYNREVEPGEIRERE